MRFIDRTLVNSDLKLFFYSTPNNFCQSFPLKVPLIILCITMAMFFGSMGESYSADYKKGLTAAKIGDYATALREFRALAEQGNPSAQYSLGLMYDNGRGVKRDAKESAKWYRKSVEQGHLHSQYNLGVMLANGDGIRQDDVYAHMWFNIVALSGDENGVMNREIVERRMTKEQIVKAQKLAMECVEKRFKGC